jgi:hypothetical protein
LPTVLIGPAPLLGLAPFELCDFELALLLALFGFATFGFACDFDLGDFDFAGDLALFGADRFLDFVWV